MHVMRFEFEYMAGRRSGGKRRPPPKAERLVPEFHEAARVARALIGPTRRLFIGGKSMGGRVASLAADELFVRREILGLVCLGYPFHPPGKSDALRTAHLVHLRCPTLIVQGEQDTFGTRAEAERYELASSIKLHWVPDGDHDLVPAKGGQAAHARQLGETARVIANFCTDQCR
jgi:hypothetical protein